MPRKAKLSKNRAKQAAQSKPRVNVPRLAIPYIGKLCEEWPDPTWPNGDSVIPSGRVRELPALYCGFVYDGDDYDALGAADKTALMDRETFECVNAALREYEAKLDAIRKRDKRREKRGIVGPHVADALEIL